MKYHKIELEYRLMLQNRSVLLSILVTFAGSSIGFLFSPIAVQVPLERVVLASMMLFSLVHFVKNT